MLKDLHSYLCLKVIWGGVFLWAATIAAVVQLVVLPYIVPEWHWGHGLLAKHDYPKFHVAAKELADRIGVQGWGAWQLRPNGHGISGVAGAIYALVVAEPWGVIPLNAALYATGVTGVVASARTVWPCRSITAVATLPALLFPSTVQIYGQIHNDVYAFAGLALTICGWITVLRGGLPQHQSSVCRLGLAVAGIVAGSLVAWVAHEYWAKVFWAIGCAACLVCVIRWSVSAVGKTIDAPGVKASIIACSLSLAILTWISVGAPIPIEWQFDAESAAAEAHENYNASSASFASAPGANVEWNKSSWLPGLAEAPIRELAEARGAFLKHHAGSRSGVDEEVILRSAKDVLFYLPRALSLGLLSPFPTDWGWHEDAPPSRNFQRLVASVEMPLSYVLMLGLVLAICRRKTRPELWLLMTLALFWVTLYGVAVPNVGGLYRYRMAGYLFVLGVGAVALASQLRMRMRMKQSDW